MTGHLAVETERLRRVYTTRGASGRASRLVVLDDVTLSVRRGEVFGLIGVNGAGKSTLLQILAAQLRPSAGTAKVAGFDVCRYAAHVRRHVGVVCADDAPVVRLRAPELSSGQRQRVSLERGFAARPKVLLLDQPTLGLDCVASREVRGFIRRWMKEDETRTVVLATNDMGEANELCDRVAVLDGGRLVTCDTPAALKDRWHPAPSGPDPRAQGAAALEAAFFTIVNPVYAR
jgi:ABC-2 type transport system ATP-binding protein